MTVFRLYMFVPITPVHMYAGYLDRRRLIWGIRGRLVNEPPNQFCRDIHAMICVTRGFRLSVLSRQLSRLSISSHEIERSGDVVNRNLLSSLLDTL